MARTVKEHEYAEKRNEILDAAQRFIYTKGYERMGRLRNRDREVSGKTRSFGRGSKLVVCL